MNPIIKGEFLKKRSIVYSIFIIAFSFIHIHAYALVDDPVSL